MQLCTVECNYCAMLHNFWQARQASFLEGMFSPFCRPALARACVVCACQQCSTWCCWSKGHRLSLSSAVQCGEWLECSALPCEPSHVDLKLLWLHGGITKTLDGFSRSVEHSLVHALVCCRSWTEYDKIFHTFPAIWLGTQLLLRGVQVNVLDLTGPFPCVEGSRDAWLRQHFVPKTTEISVPTEGQTLLNNIDRQ